MLKSPRDLDFGCFRLRMWKREGPARLTASGNEKMSDSQTTMHLVKLYRKHEFSPPIFGGFFSKGSTSPAVSGKSRLVNS